MTIQPQTSIKSSACRHIPKGDQMALTKRVLSDYSHPQEPLPVMAVSEQEPAFVLSEKDAAKASAFSESLHTNNLKTIEQKVGFILNHYPSSRDCDHELKLKFWSLWDEWDGSPIDPADLKSKLTRENSIIRCRARIQNRYQLFQASEAVRKRRRALCDEEKETAISSPDRFDNIYIFADESGKTEEFLIVGGVWISDPRELLNLQIALAKWRVESSFESELHFSMLKPQKQPLYREAIDLALSAAPSMSFKALKLPRKGISDTSAALDTLFYHYIVKGVEHEHMTNRCALPRRVRFCKDSEQPGSDLLRICRIKDKVSQYGMVHHEGKLAIGEFECKPSDQFVLLQIADLFVGSIGRVVNPGTRKNHKDEFAEYLLDKVRLTNGPEEFSESKDVSALFDM